MKSKRFHKQRMHHIRAKHRIQHRRARVAFMNSQHHFSYPYDLSEDLFTSRKIQLAIQNEQFAKELYAAICNLQWLKEDFDFDEHYKNDMQAIINNNDKYTFKDYCSVSWRKAGEIIADLRNNYYNTTETYMDWYCSGNEGIVSERVDKILAELGWVSRSWP